MCDKVDFTGIRLKCDDCFNYDECFHCWQAEGEADNHRHAKHQMLAIVAPRRQLDFSKIHFHEKLGSGCFGEAVRCCHPEVEVPLVCKVLKTTDLRSC